VENNFFNQSQKYAKKGRKFLTNLPQFDKNIYVLEFLYDGQKL